MILRKLSAIYAREQVIHTFYDHTEILSVGLPKMACANAALLTYLLTLVLYSSFTFFLAFVPKFHTLAIYSNGLIFEYLRYINPCCCNIEITHCSLE